MLSVDQVQGTVQNLIKSPTHQEEQNNDDIDQPEVLETPTDHEHPTLVCPAKDPQCPLISILSKGKN